MLLNQIWDNVVIGKGNINDNVTRKLYIKRSNKLKCKILNSIFYTKG